MRCVLRFALVTQDRSGEAVRLVEVGVRRLAKRSIAVRPAADGHGARVYHVKGVRRGVHAD